MPLTNKACENAKPRDKAYKMADSHGMYLHVMPNGRKYWRHKYRYFGKERCLAFGVYPEVSLSEARDQLYINRKLLDAGVDPASVRREQKLTAKQKADTTFEVVAKDWHEYRKSEWTDIHAAHILHRLEMDMFPEIGRLPIADIKPLQVLNAVKKIQSRGAYEQGKRALQYCGRIFRYAITHELAERDPTASLRRELKTKRSSHYATIEADEIPDFLKALANNEVRLFIQTRRAIRLMMLTFVRTSELIKAKWSEFDLDAKLWTIPAERMKMKRPHIVPLSDQAVKILREQFELTGKWEWVFPNQAHPHTHMSNMTILKALERLGYKDKMTGHGFRALAMTTIMERMGGYRHEVIDTQLAHAKSNDRAPYDRSKYLSDRTRMMQDWSNYLDKVVTGGTVIQVDFAEAAE